MALGQTQERDKIVRDIYDHLGCEEGKLSLSVIDKMLDLTVLFDRKQHDYGPDNIAGFGDFGALVRASDKVARLRNLYGKSVIQAKAQWARGFLTIPYNETIDDSWGDLAVYAVIALVVRDGNWFVG